MAIRATDYGEQSQQWRSKALRGPGSTVTWGPSIPSASPQGLKLEARSAESRGGAYGCEDATGSGSSAFLLLTCQFFRSGVFFGPGLGGRGAQEFGAPVH